MNSVNIFLKSSLFTLNACKVVAGIIVLMSISSCGLISYVPGSGKVVGEDGVFRDRQGDYLEAETIPRTVIPEGFDSYVIDDLLVVPDVNTDNVQAFLTVPRPRAVSGNPDRGVIIQRLEEESWVVVDASASQLWPRVRDYWSNSGVSIGVENPTAGVLETEWFVLTDNVLTREKFRVSVEPGFQDNSSEVRLLHFSMPQATPIGLVPEIWPETSSDPELEYEVLNSFAGYLAGITNLYQAASVSFLAGNIPSNGKAAITSNAVGENILRLEANYKRSWAAVGRALERAGIEVVTQDREAGSYQVNYRIEVAEADRQSLIGRVASLNGLLWEPSSKAGEWHKLEIHLRENGTTIDVLINNLEPEKQNTESLEQTEDSLLTIIRNYIA